MQIASEVELEILNSRSKHALYVGSRLSKDTLAESRLSKDTLYVGSRLSKDTLCRESFIKRYVM